ncbi:MAG: 1-acyl-sn-glycerol-3-phosphate acyltransferase [Desulforhopalus sp.]|jgi:1-acyl-sn-glycerol-3-phosphate acyltransferase
MQTSNNSSFRLFTAQCIDCIVTLVCWAWFIFGFIIFFSWFYLAAALFTKDPELYFQRLNSHFYQIFFRIVGLTAPRQRMVIDEKIANIRSSVIVCNHLSYLDPLLLIALFRQQKTIVKSRFFGMPIFGWVISKSGYLPASSEGQFAGMMIRQMETMDSYLKGGGNLFIFPEGTRSRDGKMGTLNKGAFKIARMYRVPIYVLEIRNTDKLFTPGKFFFNTRINNDISVKIIDCIESDHKTPPPSTAVLEQRVRQAFGEKQI